MTKSPKNKLRDFRLNQSEQFRRVFKTGTRLSSQSLVVRFLPSPDGANRISYVLRKKTLKRAVHRNAVRRQIREAFRVSQDSLKRPMWFIFDYQPKQKNVVERGLYQLANLLIHESSLKAAKKWPTYEINEKRVLN